MTSTLAVVMTIVLGLPMDGTLIGVATLKRIRFEVMMMMMLLLLHIFEHFIGGNVGDLRFYHIKII